MSIFHPDYPSSIAFNYLYLFVGVWEGQYEALDYAEREVEKLREDIINNLLNTTSSADFAITNLISELKIQNSSQKNWLYGHSDEANKIINFLNANRINGNVNVEAVSFSILAVEALMKKIPVIFDIKKGAIFQGSPLNFNTITPEQKVSVVINAIKETVSDNTVYNFDINKLFYNLPTDDVDVVAKILIDGKFLDVRIIFGVYSNLQISEFPNNTSQFGPLSGKVGNYIIGGYWWTMKFRSYGAKYGHGADALWVTIKQKGQYNFENSDYLMNYLGY